MRVAALLCLLLTSVIVTSAVAGAQERITSPEIDRMRDRLAEYDLDGERTYSAIYELGQMESSFSDEAHQREARFMRAVAAADLLLIAHHIGRDDVLGRLSQAYGADAPVLHARVATDLGPLMRGVYQETAEDAWWVLEVLAERREIDWSTRGQRRDSLFLSKVRRALSGSNQAELAELVEDPCNNVSELSCPVDFRGYDSETRRQLKALVDAQRAVRRVLAAAEGGDPLSRALVDIVQHDAQIISDTMLVPRPQVPASMGLLSTAHGSEVSPDLVVVVHGNELRYGWSPQIRVDTRGFVHVTAKGSPVLPATTSVPIPEELRPVMIPISELVSALRPVAEGLENATVMIGASEDVRVFKFARVLVSLQAAGLAPSHLVGTDPQHRVVGVPINVVRAIDARPTLSRVRLRVILNGYVYREPARSATIPRLITADGREYDTSTLAGMVGDRAYGRAMVKPMSVVRMGPVVDASFIVAPQSGALDFVIP